MLQFDAFMDYLKKDKNASENTLTAYGRDIRAFDRYMAEKGSSIEKANKTDVVSYIMEHLSEDVSLEELAKKASLSPFYFSRLFKKETGFTPHDYILTTRINHAKFLLLTSSLSIKDICFQLGFSSESAFCTAFKKKIGETPSEFRTNHTTML
jgi:AraC-like DNA-binding protein